MTGDGELLDEVIARIAGEFEPGERAMATDFAQAYLRRRPSGDDRSAEEWLAEIRGLFEFIRVRTDPFLVRVFNPDPDTDGYGSRGTVVEVNIEDGPFLLDSLTNEIQAHGLEVARVTHPVIGVDRDSTGRLTWVGHARHARHKESVEHYELDRKLFPADLPGLERAIRIVLSDIKAAIKDFHPMMDRIKRMVEIVRRATGFYPEADLGESIAFLQWLRDENFVFLGYREYKLDEEDGQALVRAEPGTGLGILSDHDGSAAKAVPLATMRPELAARYKEGDLLIITKTNRLSTVHRRVRLDYIGVRVIGPTGATLGEARLVGLFTSKAFMEPASHVPILRRKLADVVTNEDLIEGSHDHKAVIQIFEGYSKHDLFTAPTAALQREIMGLLALQETHQVRLFLRRDIMERSVSIMVALPRDRFNAELRKALQDLFMNRFNGTAVDYHLELGEADPARIHFTVWVDGQIPEVGYDQLESDVLSMTRSWGDRVTEELAAKVGLAEARRVADVWTGRFPDYYRVSASLEAAAEDILALEALSMSEDSFHVGLRNETDAGEPLTRVVLYRSDGKRPLSELVPALEAMGMQVVEEVPTRIGAGDKFFIHDFGVLGSDGEPLDLKGCEARVAAALTAVWSGQAESDALNALVITGAMTHWAVGILRAYRVYWRRLAMSFTVGYLNDVLNAHPQLAADLITLFELRFDPGRSDDEVAESLERSILERLDAIPSLDHDRILRSFYRLIKATLRTNAYQGGRTVLSVKLRSRDVPDMPKPIPFAEIFVYGLEIEGIHLRGGPVARGGIRWSDRREDYRTEVLGLMKAQVTKNAVIVPTGAKGGFVLRRPPTDPMLVPHEVREQYESYIRALLDVTDNLEKGQPVHPERVRVLDDPDPYLVVAADRGTATFSDLANSIALEKRFWLGDAFASGGSAGYDHKKLGITARGAWKSLERHFIELGLDPHRQPFTVVGIGDMSGDVFGNGMLGSDQIRLVAAFDHRHIFIDPDPDPQPSFAERRRVFDLPSSSWDDYDRQALSPGGGVWSRSVKQIELSEQARVALGVTEVKWAPLQLVRAILLAPVDLLWNGGIGTYVKASTESNEAVGDRSNDPVRVDGASLRSRVVVEGGNLGLTQAGRVEYAMAGGKINTDFIDNSGGVNCSDREVNLKILLGLAEERGEITRAERNRLVAASAAQVVDRILYDNFQQAQMISQEERAAIRRVGAHEQLMVQLESEGLLDRALEGVPSSEVLTERSRAGKGLTRPEIAVLLVDAKRSLKISLASSDLVDDPSLLEDLNQYFPDEASARFQALIPAHPLRRELTATVLANDVVNSVGATFVSRMTTRSGATKADVVKAYRIARDASNAKPRWEEIEQLVNVVDLNVWFELMTGQDRVVASLTRRYLARLPKTTLAEAVAADRLGFAEFEDALTEAGPDHWRQAHRSEEAGLVEAGVPVTLARRHVFRRQLVHGPNAIELAKIHERKVAEVAEIMFHAGDAVGLDRLEAIAGGFHFTDSWQRWALEALEDDLVEIRRTLTRRILQVSGDLPPQEALAEFMEAHAGAIGRLNAFVASLGTEQPENLAPLMIGIRQLRALIG